MKSGLPVILGVGKFNSEQQFKTKAKSPKRNVNCYELELFSKNGGCCYVNDKKYPIKKGSILFARPGDVRYSSLPIECHFVHFFSEDENINSILDKMPCFINDSIYEDFNYIFKEIKTATFSENITSKILSAGKLLELICKIKDLCEDINKHNLIESDDFILKGIRYMSAHFREDIKIEDVARNSNLSVSHFHKLFLEQQGTTPSQYLTNIRISKAKELLLTTNKPMPEIAEQSGFTSQAYFCYAFKKETGETPSAFRSSFAYPENQTFTKPKIAISESKKRKPNTQNKTAAQSKEEEKQTKITESLPSYLL